MKYVYFVAYIYWDEKDQSGHGTKEVTSPVKLDSVDKIRNLEDYIKKESNYSFLQIRNFQLLREEGEDGKSVEWDYIKVARAAYVKIKADSERFDESVIGLYVNLHGLEKCEFDDGCDSCESPVAGMWVAMTYPAEQNPEALYYICGKCILDSALKIVAEESEKSAGR